MSMTSKNIRRLLMRSLIVACALRLFCETAIADTATGKRWMVATGHPIATDAAADVFRDGGNAVDAAVAAALTLGVVDGNNSGIGGGCLILVRSADGQLTAIDGREMAPAAAHKDMFLRGRQTDARRQSNRPAGRPAFLAHWRRTDCARSLRHERVARAACAGHQGGRRRIHRRWPAGFAGASARPSTSRSMAAHGRTIA